MLISHYCDVRSLSSAQRHKFQENRIAFLIRGQKEASYLIICPWFVSCHSISSILTLRFLRRKLPTRKHTNQRTPQNLSGTPSSLNIRFSSIVNVICPFFPLRRSALETSTLEYLSSHFNDGTASVFTTFDNATRFIIQIVANKYNRRHSPRLTPPSSMDPSGLWSSAADAGAGARNRSLPTRPRGATPGAIRGLPEGHASKPSRSGHETGRGRTWRERQGWYPAASHTPTRSRGTHQTATTTRYGKWPWGGKRMTAGGR
jgi:hypothetical protein